MIVWWGLDWMREFLLLEGDEHLKMVENDDIAIDGSFPINPSGGLESKGHPIAATGTAMIAELVWQLRGEAGTRQIPDVNVGLAQSWRGVPTATGAVAILSNM